MAKSDGTDYRLQKLPKKWLLWQELVT